MRNCILFVLVVVCIYIPASPTSAQTEVFGIEDLSFITGTWQGEIFGGKADETWLPPRDGTMSGMFRLTWKDGRRLFELLLIEENQEGKVEMFFRHFDSGMRIWPKEIESPNRFELVKAGSGIAVFGAPDRNQKPARIKFALASGGEELAVTVTSKDKTGNIEESFEVRYQRVRP